MTKLRSRMLFLIQITVFLAACTSKSKIKEATKKPSSSAAVAGSTETPAATHAELTDDKGLAEAGSQGIAVSAEELSETAAVSATKGLVNKVVRQEQRFFDLLGSSTGEFHKMFPRASEKVEHGKVQCGVEDVCVFLTHIKDIGPSATQHSAIAYPADIGLLEIQTSWRDERTIAARASVMRDVLTGDAPEPDEFYQHKSQKWTQMAVWKVPGGRLQITGSTFSKTPDGSLPYFGSFYFIGAEVRMCPPLDQCDRDLASWVKVSNKL